MVLNECRQTIARCFSILEKERLSDEGITAVCDMRKAAGELFEQASNYEDALMLLNRLTKSAVNDSSGSNVFANPFWEQQEREKAANNAKTDVFEKSVDEVEEKDENLFESFEPIPKEVEEETPVKRTSIRGSGRIAPTSKTEARDIMKDEVRADQPLTEPLYDALYVEETVDPEVIVTDVDEVETIPKDTAESFENDFKDRFDFENDLSSDAMVESYDGEKEIETNEFDDDLEDLFFDDDEHLNFDPDDLSAEQGVFEEDELPDYAVSYADDPYILADDFVENLDEEDMELFIQMGQDDDDVSEDIVRPGTLEKRGPKEEPKPTHREAVENARDKFYMPAKSRIAMIRGVEPEDGFNGVDLLKGYKNDEPEDEYDAGIPTEDELRNAETDFFDEPEEEPKGPSPIMEKVSAPEEEERDDADPTFDDDTLGISVDKSLLMDDDEFDHRYKVDMITTIAEHDARAETYRDKMEKLASVSFTPIKKEDEDDA